VNVDPNTTIKGIFARKRMRRLYTLAVGLVRMVERIIV
jgi:hypothetical protein